MSSSLICGKIVNLTKIVLNKNICVLCVNVCRCTLRAEEDIRSPEAGVTANCELPDVGSGNQIQVFCKSNICSEP